ncbi:60S ribosomal protein L29 [Polytolypa hystricis UAMH7299]|uniref:60S ribosomal protein L29 n=1 Tax=Polytolypa hystricis (strain UAMH7299) TaxID=1447883 RepID=A0A2B7YQE1_POLH7|nr:60S ribosomal protein L29 [Polytolypa hystricis UAMH7299]
MAANDHVINDWSTAWKTRRKTYSGTLMQTTPSSPSPTPSRSQQLRRCDNTVKMAKSKNSSQATVNKKAHRNGIKKVKTHRYPSLKGVDPKFRRNHRHALHGTMKALKEVKEGKRESA